MERLERILGGLFGVACGDALGGTLEFMDKSTGKKLYGYHTELIGGGVMNLRPGDVTDDTIMTLAVAEGIIENPKDPISKIGERFIKWYLSKPKDIGTTCELAFRRYMKSHSWEDASIYVHKKTDGWTAGNGTLMRCIPVALYYRDFNKMIDVTIAQSKMTHYDDKASEACVLYNTIVHKYISGEDKEQAVIDTLKGHKIYEDILSMDEGKLNPSGYVVDSFICALWCFLNNTNFEDAITEAVNLYGDPDTIGAITGGVAGVYYGYESIPNRWKEKLLIKLKLMKVAEKLSNPL